VFFFIVFEFCQFRREILVASQSVFIGLCYVSSQTTRCLHVSFNTLFINFNSFNINLHDVKLTYEITDTRGFVYQFPKCILCHCSI